MTTFRTLAALAFVAALAACTTVSRMEGEQSLGDHMSVQVSEAWNKMDLPGSGKQPYQVWTQEGLYVDQLRFWPGVASGQPLLVLPSSLFSSQKPPRVPTFTAGMAPDQLVALFETLYSVDGSVVTVKRVAPAVFGGEQGVRFEFTVARKSDDVQLAGTGWAAVRGGQLYAATFLAPQLGFYSRLLPKAEAVVQTTRIRG